MAQLIGTGPEQIPTNGMLGSMAFQNAEGVNLSGTPKAPTAAAGTNTTQIATTAFVKTATIENKTSIGTFSGGSVTIDLSSNTVFSATLTAAITSAITITNINTSGKVNTFILDLTNGGAYSITWMTGIKWAGGTAPTLTASGRDILGFISHDGGTTWNGLLLAKDIR